jgi:hypothetical protein
MYSALAGKYKGVTGSSACISSTNSASQNKDKYTKNTETKNPRLTFRMKNLLCRKELSVTDAYLKRYYRGRVAVVMLGARVMFLWEI